MNQDVTLSKKKLRELLREAYHKGWERSGEGYNAEYPSYASDEDRWKNRMHTDIAKIVKQLD